MIYNEIRPRTIDALYGDSLEPIRRDIENNSIARVYLFHGMTGVGKTATAMVIANSLENCLIDPINVAGASQKKDVEKILKSASTIPIGYKTKLLIFNEMHKASAGYESALNDFIEFPPKGIYIIMTTTDIDKVLADIKGRSKKVHFKPLSKEDIVEVLLDGREACVNQSELPTEVVDLIYTKSEGSARNALTELELISDTDDEEEMLRRLSKPSVLEETNVMDLFTALYEARPWGELVKILNRLNTEKAEGVRRVLLKIASSKSLSGYSLTEVDMETLYDIMRIFNKKIYEDFKDLVESCLEYCYGK